MLPSQKNASGHRGLRAGPHPTGLAARAGGSRLPAANGSALLVKMMRVVSQGLRVGRRSGAALGVMCATVAAPPVDHSLRSMGAPHVPHAVPPSRLRAATPNLEGVFVGVRWA